MSHRNRQRYYISLATASLVRSSVLVLALYTLSLAYVAPALAQTVVDGRPDRTGNGLVIRVPICSSMAIFRWAQPVGHFRAPASVIDPTTPAPNGAATPGVDQSRNLQQEPFDCESTRSRSSADRCTRSAARSRPKISIGASALRRRDLLSVRLQLFAGRQRHHRLDDRDPAARERHGRARPHPFGCRPMAQSRPAMRGSQTCRCNRRYLPGWRLFCCIRTTAA